MPENVHASSDKPLVGLRIVEFASFVAGPSGGMTLGQLGADVIRIDPLGGAADYNRWPVSQQTGKSLYWNSLNRGKRSVAINVRDPRGQELVLGLATAPGPDTGLVIDNNPNRPWFGYEAFAARRPDMIQVHIEGHADGRAAVDYTVNTEYGVAELTGPMDSATPVNAVLPAWDLIAGMTATTGLLAALHKRSRTGVGSYLQLALADVTLAGVANLGWLSEVAERGDRPRHGNYMYGSFGVDFTTSDGERVMVVALTPRQWAALGTATGNTEVFAALEKSLDADFRDEAERYRHREVIAAVLRPWFNAHGIDEVRAGLTEAGALWSQYRTLAGVVDQLRSGATLPVLADLEQPGIGQVVSAHSPLRIDAEYSGTVPAPELGAHTDEILGSILGLTDSELGELHDAGVI
ncbi:CoA transferase [Jongsikchunia kroppenstedtii]|uniref:CoA transferase n=1 Tax=Jongsikchunia kroppenstedtii TaxID=1121721 RepID=UPI00036C082F|nr:CoA transferase [Jongsikchunia kroppenstedtii]